MDWDTPYRVSRALVLEVAGYGRLTAARSLSGDLQELTLDALPVLTAFSPAATPRQALARLREDWDLDEEGFAAVVARFVAGALLIPAAGGGTPPLAGGFASVPGHLDMLRDTTRTLAYRAAIFRHAPGRSVVEIGCGSGILSIFAAQAGARRVVAIEETGIATLAAEMFRANGCGSVVELRQGNSRDVELDEPADLLVHELLGVDPFVENIVPTVLDARRRFLAPGGRLLPFRFEVFCLGVELEERPFRDQRRVLAETDELQGILGVDLGPLHERLAALDLHFFDPPVAEEADPLFRPRILSDELRLYDVDFRTGAPDVPERLIDAHLRIRESGALNGVVLYFRAHLDETIRLANSPFLPPTSWRRDIRPVSRRLVAPGDEVPLTVRLIPKLGRHRLAVDLAPRE